MPVTPIPFKSPAPFALPEHLTQALAELPRDEAAKQVLAILDDAGCADLMVLLWHGPAGWSAGPAYAHDALTLEAATVVTAEAAAQGEAGFLQQAAAGGQSLLLMGEVAASEPDSFPGSLRQGLLGGAERASVGFMYVFPLEGGAGALMLQRSLGAGPLNHDQPAIVHSMVLELGRIAAR